MKLSRYFSDFLRFLKTVWQVLSSFVVGAYFVSAAISVNREGGCSTFPPPRPMEW